MRGELPNEVVSSRRLRGGVAQSAAPILVALLLAACTPKSASTTTADGQAANTEAGSSAANAAASSAPGTADSPPAVVAEDPQIPLNEAVVGSAPVAEDFYATRATPGPVIEDEVWYPGSWGLVGPGRYGWTPGLWAAPGYVRDDVAIGEAPPAVRFETYGAAPGADFVWMPGYYGWRGGSYLWIGGSWGRPPVVGLGWIEPRYVGVWGHYYFQPGRWDFAVGARGTVYLPDINVRAGMHCSPHVAPLGVVSARAAYVTASSRAIAHGAVRSANGSFVAGTGAAHPGSEHGGEHGAHPEPEGHGLPAEGHGATETHPGTEPHGAPAHEAHHAAPVSPKAPAPTQHARPPHGR